MSQQVELQTSKGNIRIELDDAKAPESAKNFLAYVAKGHYDGTVFHRVIKGFMVQGGGFEPGMKQKPTDAPIRNEANNGLKNDKYTLAMARTSDPHSATAQFFINVADNTFLDHRSPDANGWGYCVFGRVVAGNEIVDHIKGLPTATRGSDQNVPTEDVVIERAQGVWVYDVEGHRYLDCLAAYSAVNQGHCHPEILKTLAEYRGNISRASQALGVERSNLYRKMKQLGIPYLARENGDAE